MAGEVILAVAGSGKTTAIGEVIDESQKNLVVTYTNKNVENLTKAISNSHGRIPSGTQVMTFSRFVFYWMIRPFQKEIAVKFGVPFFESKGIDITNPPENDYKNPGNGYYKVDNINHYKSKTTNKFFNNRMSDLYKKQSGEFKKNVRGYLDKYVDNIYIDEFQDFSESDFDLLINLTKCKKVNIRMFGDYFQSLVTKSDYRHAKRPYKNTNYVDFKKLLRKEKINIDESSLHGSWRVHVKTCDYIKENLAIDIGSNSSSKLGVETISTREEAREILNDKRVMKLFYNRASKGYSTYLPSNRWGYSKGDTYTGVCIVLTQNAWEALVLHKQITAQMQHTIYVALTRSQGITYLLPPEFL